MPKPRSAANSDKQSVSGQQGNGKGFTPVTFVDGYLDDNDRKWLADNYQDSTTLIVDLIGEIEDYGGISCKYDAKSGKFLAILFGGDLPETNTGFALTSRASTPHDALYALSYKHIVKFSRKWGSAAGSAGSRWE